MNEPKDVVIVGAGVGGLSTALALSRSGHHVVMLERDDHPVPERFEESFAWDRQGAPQFHHSHAFLPRLRKILVDRFPDVHQALLDRGVPDHSMAEALFGIPDDMPGAEDLVGMPCRRTTYEWVLRNVVSADPKVELRTGVNVTGLVGGTEGGVPRITGVRLDGGSTITADFVVATTGRRGDVPAWLEPFGVTIEERVEESGITYLSRFYRTNPGQTPPEMGYIAARRAGLAYCGFEADNRTFSLTLLPDPTDSELRRHLHDEERFDATCALFPEIAHFVDRDVATPITPVHVMAGLINRLRTFADGDGNPLVQGFFAVGDAYMVTNPVYARGCSLAMVQAIALADAIAEHPGDPGAQGRSYEAVSAREVAPWFHICVLLDAMTASTDDGSDFAIGASGGIAGVITDHDVALAFARVFSMLDTPDRLYTDPKLMAVMSGNLGGGSPTRPAGNIRLTRADLLNATAA